MNSNSKQILAMLVLIVIVFGSLSFAVYSKIKEKECKLYCQQNYDSYGSEVAYGKCKCFTNEKTYVKERGEWP